MNKTSVEQQYYFKEVGEDEHSKHQFEGLIFALMAGSAAIVMGMLLFKRALLISFLQQWRFLAINLLFLTIISLKSSGHNKNHTETNTKNSNITKSYCDDDEYSKIAVEEAVKGDGYEEMTEEELNRRSEEFIARFRMQLVSDQAKKRANRVELVN